MSVPFDPNHLTIYLAKIDNAQAIKALLEPLYNVFIHPKLPPVYEILITPYDPVLEKFQIYNGKIIFWLVDTVDVKYNKDNAFKLRRQIPKLNWVPVFEDQLPEVASIHDNIKASESTCMKLRAAINQKEINQNGVTSALFGNHYAEKNTKNIECTTNIPEGDEYKVIQSVFGDIVDLKTDNNITVMVQPPETTVPQLETTFSRVTTPSIFIIRTKNTAIQQLVERLDFDYPGLSLIVLGVSEKLQPRHLYNAIDTLNLKGHGTWNGESIQDLSSEFVLQMKDAAKKVV